MEAEATTFVHSLDTFMNSVYWTDGDKKTVERTNKYSGGNINVLRHTLQFPYDIRVWHPLKQPIPSGEKPILSQIVKHVLSAISKRIIYLFE